jgi:hypothetical protein
VKAWWWLLSKRGCEVKVDCESPRPESQWESTWGRYSQIEGDREIHLFSPTDFKNKLDSLTQATTFPLWIHKTKFTRPKWYDKFSIHNNASVYCLQIFAKFLLHSLLLLAQCCLSLCLPSPLAWPLSVSTVRTGKGAQGTWCVTHST